MMINVVATLLNRERCPNIFRWCSPRVRWSCFRFRFGDTIERNNQRKKTRWHFKVFECAVIAKRQELSLSRNCSIGVRNQSTLHTHKHHVLVMMIASRSSTELISSSSSSVRYKCHDSEMESIYETYFGCWCNPLSPIVYLSFCGRRWLGVTQWPCAIATITKSTYIDRSIRNVD